MIARKDDGYLENPEEWTEDLAYGMATDDNLDLTENHMKLIREARRMYDEDSTVPPLRKFLKEVGMDKKEMYSLFLNGPMKMISMYGALPKPTGCV